MRSTPLLISLALLVCTASCGSGGVDDGRLRVIVSVEPHAFLVERIGGDRVTVMALAGPGESPASYQPSDLQVTEVMRSALYFRTGVPFERGKWLPAILSRSDGPRIVDLREGLTLRTMESGHRCEDDHDHGAHSGIDSPDPHVWLSTKLLAKQAETIARELSAADPEGAELFAQNLQSVTGELGAVALKIGELLLPVAGKRILVFHPAFGYFCDEFGLKQAAIEAEGKAPSDQELTILLAKAREDGVRAIFVQEQITGRAAQAIADSLGVALIRLDPLARDVPKNLLHMAKEVRQAYE